MFNNFPMKIRGVASSEPRRQVANNDQALLDDLQNGFGDAQSEDNAFATEKKTGEFGSNQFWKQPEQYDIDDLLAEMEDAQ